MGRPTLWRYGFKSICCKASWLKVGLKWISVICVRAGAKWVWRQRLELGSLARGRSRRCPRSPGVTPWSAQHPMPRPGSVSSGSGGGSASAPIWAPGSGDTIPVIRTHRALGCPGALIKYQHQGKCKYSNRLVDMGVNKRDQKELTIRLAFDRTWTRGYQLYHSLLFWQLWLLKPMFPLLLFTWIFYAEPMGLYSIAFV